MQKVPKIVVLHQTSPKFAKKGRKSGVSSAKKNRGVMYGCL